MPSTDYSCILSTLEFVLKFSTNYGVPAIVTFDQPLFWKATEICLYTPHLQEIILMLGGFHARMAFIKNIGHLMANSGLEEGLCTIYAENSSMSFLTLSICNLSTFT